MRNSARDVWDVVKKTAVNWYDSEPWRQSAILAYFSIFSVPAFLLIVIVIVGYFYGEEAVSQQLSARIADTIGEESARMVELMVADAADTGSSRWAMLVGIGLLIFGSTTVFYHLQLSLNRIWGVVPHPEKAFLKYLKDRLLSFCLVLVIGFLLLLSMLVNSILALLSDWIISHWQEARIPLMIVSNYGVTLAITTVLFAFMFKFLPDAVIRWRSVWIGSLLTAVLFLLGQYGLRIYFRNYDPVSAYGAAGALLLIIIWVSYVALIVLFGAEFTKQWATKFGHGITPKKSATLHEGRKDKYHVGME